MSIRKDILRKLLDKYGEDNVYEIITSAGHRIQLVDGKYKFNDSDDVLEMDQVIEGRNKLVYFSYDTFDIIEFDDVKNPIYAYPATQPIDIAISSSNLTITAISLTDINKEERTGTLKYTINNYKGYDPDEIHRVKLGDEYVMDIHPELVTNTTNQFTATVYEIPAGNIDYFVQYICGLTVVNSADVSCNVPFPNRAPEVTNIKVTNMTHTGDCTITYTATDADGDKLTHKFNAVEITPTKQGDNYTLNKTGMTSGKYTLAVSDGMYTTNHVLYIDMPENYAPELTNVKVSGITNTGNCTISYTATDKNGDTLTHKLDNVVIKPTKTDDNYTLNKTGMVSGIYTLSVSDGVNTTSETLDIVIPENHTPVLKNVKVSDITPTGNCTIMYNVEDLDNDILTHTINNVVVTPVKNGDIYTINKTGLSTGQNKLSLIVSDGAAEDEAVFIVTIPEPANNPPVVTDVKVIEAKADGTYKVSYKVTDVDGDNLSHWLQVDNAQLVGITPTKRNGVCVYSGNKLSQGQHNIVIEVSDGKVTVAGRTKVTIPAPPKPPVVETPKEEGVTTTPSKPVETV